MRKDGIVILQDPGDARGSQGVGAAELGEVGVVRGLVDGLEGEVRGVLGGLDESEDCIDCVQTVFQVAGRVEPVAAADTLADLESVDATGKTVKVDNDVHVILVDGIVGDGAKIFLLVTVVELRARDFDPCGVGRGDTQDIDARLGKGVDDGLVNPSGVALLEDGAALGA